MMASARCSSAVTVGSPLLQLPSPSWSAGHGRTDSVHAALLNVPADGASSVLSVLSVALLVSVACSANK